MEAENVKNVVSDALLKTPDKDGDKRDFDFVNNGQIMVTITLAEYRALVKRNSDQEVSDARSKVWAAERERDEMKKQVADLQKQLDDLKKVIAGAASVQNLIGQEKDG